MTQTLSRNIMENFIHQENIELYRRLLAETTDEGKRDSLLNLMRAEAANRASPPIKCKTKPLN